MRNDNEKRTWETTMRNEYEKLDLIAGALGYDSESHPVAPDQTR